MAKVKLYNQQGKSAGDIDLNASIFEVEPIESVVHEVMVAQQANSRQVLAHTKDRGEVRGGGRKPWRQKGTGRARHGSIRSPIWIGGGITFGPRKIRNFSKKVNRNVKRKALAMTLSDKVNNNQFVVVDSLEMKDHKTKEFNKVLKNLLKATNKKTLIVVKSDNLNVKRAAKNLPKIDTIAPNSLNVVDVLNHEFVVVSKDALDVVTETYKK